MDVSGSMNDFSKLILLKEALVNLINLLNEGDRVCLIAFSNDAERLTRLVDIGKEENKQNLKEQIEKLVGKGGTNINSGMYLALEVLR